MQAIPDGLLFGLLFLCGVGVYLAMTARTPRQERQARSWLYMTVALAITFGAAALFGGAA